MKQQSRFVIVFICLALLAGCGPARRDPSSTPGAATSQTATASQARPTGTATTVTETITSATVLPTAGPDKLVASIREAAHPLTGSEHDYDPLMTLVGDARFVLLGEATHGTKEFYEERARITRRLIKEKGFNAVAVEADWPNAYQVNRYVRGYTEGTSEDAGPEKALAGFKSFPQWMWSNTSMRDLVQWLRDHNDRLPQAKAQVGFYGLDLYSAARSAHDVVQYLEQVDPAAAQVAGDRYACIAPDSGDKMLSRLSPKTGERLCETQLLQQVEEMEQRAADLRHDMSPVEREELFSALQNARVAKNGTAYFQGTYDDGMSSWNWRDLHMADTADMLAEHLSVQGKPAKVVIWAHNSHVGDAQATQLGRAGEWNIGQLTRERHKEDTVLVGFSTYTGTVMAARSWDEPGERKNVLPALPESDAALFSETGLDTFLLTLRDNTGLAEMLSGPRLQRAIGVVYYPEAERSSHYFEAQLSEQFDAVIHIDETNAVEPLNP